MYVYCIKRLAHVQSYRYSALWRPWVFKTFCDLVTDVCKAVCVEVFMFESMLMRNRWKFSVTHCNNVFSSALAMGDRSDMGR